MTKYKPKWMKQVDNREIPIHEFDDYQFMYWLKDYLVKVHLAKPDNFYIQRLDEIIMKGYLR